MKQVIQSARSGKLAVREVPAPAARPGHLLVRTRASLISAGTERMMTAFARKSLAGKARARPDLVRKVMDKARSDGVMATLKAVMARLDEPFPLGYSAAGEVIAVGAGLEGEFRVGQRVAVAGAGLANHAEINVVPRNLAATIPDGVSDSEACFGTLGAIAMHAVRNLGMGLGDVVAVIGCGLVGQLATQLAALAGSRVIVLDYDAERLKLAAGHGAEATFDLSQSGLDAAVAAMTSGRGCDGVLIAAATESSEPLQTAAAVARDRARVVMVGMTGTEFSYADFMKKELNLVVSRSYGPGRYDTDFENRGMKYPEGWVRWTETENLAECVRLMDPALPTRLDVAALTTHRFDIGAAEQAYVLVTEGAEAHLGVVLTYPDGEPTRAPVTFPAPALISRGSPLRVGMIGAGAFARAMLLPALKGMDGVTLQTVAARRGSSAEHAQRTFGFVRAETEAQAVLEATDVDAVIIATRHDSHAALTAAALAAGKPVLVEKPLGMTMADIDLVANARQASSAFFQVGFNRRFAPLSIQSRDILARSAGPRFVVIRVNAGAVPADSWLNSESEGGGRVLGEVCHFVDLARFLTGAPIVSVQADTMTGTHGTAEDISATLAFADGSLATIAYTSQGDAAYGKELIEAFAGGKVATIDNFRSLTTVTDGKTSRTRSRVGQDKGIATELAAFAAAARAGGPAPIDESELIESSRATIALLESLRAGVRISLS
ncbi:MAG: bi-domain-containing oxidoreductase [Proteobacteria bacterium]|nr:bi-domain-containing oxidoreductase [Pseudomonadota bacterium]